MTERTEETLTRQLAALHEPPRDPDWADVKRRARRLTRRRRALRGGAGAAAIVGAVLAASPAFGIGGQIVRLFSGAEPAPVPVVKSFSDIDVGAPVGMATGVVSGAARDVMEAPLSTGGRAVVWVAPTKSGGFCTFVSASPNSLGGGGCDRDRSLRFAPGLSVPGITRAGKLLPPVILGGDTLIEGAATVEVQFQDESSATTPVVWVSPPINAGFFVYEVPKPNWAAGRRPTALVLRDSDGNELARDTEIVAAMFVNPPLPPKAHMSRSS